MEKFLSLAIQGIVLAAQEMFSECRKTIAGTTTTNKKRKTTP